MIVFSDGDPGPEIRRKLNEMVGTWEDALENAFGPKGWSPVLSVATDGTRRVFQVVDWVGGEGTKPTLLGYIGSTGIVADIAQAVDVRGPSGAGAGNVNPTGVIAADDLAAFADASGQVIKALKAANLPVSTAQAAAIAARYGKNNVLGPVSQSAGVPTGAVIERGSNANGAYVRFADGTQICTHFVLVSGAATASGQIFSSPSNVWTFPAVFFNKPVFYANEAAGNGFTWAGLGAGATSTTHTTFALFRSAAATVSSDVALCAIGRWF